MRKHILLKFKPTNELWIDVVWENTEDVPGRIYAIVQRCFESTL